MFFENTDHYKITIGKRFSISADFQVLEMVENGQILCMM
jgi:hypothetical protein